MEAEKKAWAEPPLLWLWGLLLAFALLPAFMGLNMSDSLSYYLDVVFGAFIFSWLGTSVGRDHASVRRLLKLLALLGTLFALHALLETTTGIFLFKDGRHDLFLTTVAGNYALGNSGLLRVDSFFANPDTTGGFFAAMLFLPLGLCFESRRPFEKAIYGAEFVLMVLALFFTYSAGALLTAGVTFVIFAALVGRIHAIMLGIARLALRNWALADMSTRALLGGGLALAVSLS